MTGLGHKITAAAAWWTSVFFVPTVCFAPSRVTLKRALPPITVGRLSSPLGVPAVSGRVQPRVAPPGAVRRNDDGVDGLDDSEDAWIERIESEMFDRGVTGWDGIQVLPSVAYATATGGTAQGGLSRPPLAPTPDPTLLEILRWTDPPPVTSAFRRRRDAEIYFLTAMALGEDEEDGYCDDGESLEELARFWFAERGKRAALKLAQADGLMDIAVRKAEGGFAHWGSVHQLEQAERMLRELILRYGVHWSEPLNRLAMILFVRGRAEDSVVVLEAALAAKPWHVGAQRGMICARREAGDEEGARRWEAKCLPPRDGPALGSKRTDWVWRAVNKACGTMLQEDEESDIVETNIAKLDNAVWGDYDNSNDVFCFDADKDSNTWQ